MNAIEFEASAISILGTAVGWQSKIARRIPSRDGKHVSIRQVQRWIEADNIPEWAEREILRLMGGTERSPFPRDEWVVGDGVSGDGRRREYIVHLAEPRFVARIVATDEDGQPLAEEYPADVLSGIVYAADDETVFCEIEWWDQPKAGHITLLMESAADVLDAIADMDQRLA